MKKSAPSPKKTPSTRLPILLGIGLVVLVGVGIAIGMTLNRTSTLNMFELDHTVSAASPLELEFSQSMDHESVEKSLTMPDGVEGTKTWKGNTLVFTPSKPLDADATYEFVLARDAKLTDGTALGKEMVFRFTVAGAPVVSARTPAMNSMDVPTDAKVTIVFDRPMVPLAQVQGAPAEGLSASLPVKIEPAIPGTWRWISTYAAQLEPTGKLLPGTLYAVNVPAGIATVSGEKTTKDESWKFETERPRVLSSNPEEGYALAGPTTEMTLNFNQEVNPESIGRHLTLVRTGAASSSSPSANQPMMAGAPMTSTGSLPTGTALEIKSLKYGMVEKDGKKVTDKRSIVVTPGKPLEKTSSYALSLSAGALGAQGNLGTKENVIVHFSTVGPLAVESSRYEYGSIMIDFTSPVPEADGKFIDLKPKPKEWDTKSASVNTWSDARELTIAPGELEPSTEYTLTVGKEFTDAYGQHLEKPYVYKFKTPELDPGVAIEYSKGDFGIFEKNKPVVYQLTAANVSVINVEFSRLSLQEFMKIRAENLNGYQTIDLKGKDLYHAWTLPAPKKRNSWEVVTLDLEKKLGSRLQPGIYAVQIRAPEFSGNGRPDVIQQFFAVTNTSLTLKYSGDKALVWATDVETGNPVAGADITFHTLRETTPITGKTNAQGFFETKISMVDFKNYAYEWKPEFWVTLAKDGDFAFVSSTWNGGFDPGDFSLWSDFHTADAPPYRLMQQIITDRPMYRPGDTVSFKGIVRLKDWAGQLQLPTSGQQMKVAIEDPNGTEVYNKTLSFSTFGGIQDTFKTATNAPTGTYSFRVQMLPETIAGDQPTYSETFSVMEYRKPEYKLDLTSKVEDSFDGKPLDVDIDGAYYFGAPLSNAPVTWNVELSDYYFNKYTDGWYSFSLEDSWCWWNCSSSFEQLTEGEGKLDGAGHMHIHVPVSLDDKKLSQIATIEATVTDANHQQVSNRLSIPVHKSAVYVGVRNEDYAVAPGKEAAIGVVTVDFNGQPVSNKNVTLSLSSRVWNTVRKKGVDGQYYYDNETVDTFIRNDSVTTDEKGKVTAKVLLPAGGAYVIKASAKDDKGRESVASTSVYAWSSTYVNWPHQNNNRIDVLADKPEYKVGDTAKLLVKSPFQGKGVKALVTVERDSLMTKKVIDVESNALPIEIPITEDLVPNAYVSVVIVKPRVGETFDDEGRDTGVPAFRIGYVQLRIETTKKHLTVTLKSDKQQYLPGEKVTANLHVADSDGKAVEGEFTFAAVDMSVLALAGYRMPDLIQNFYADHGLGVYTSQMLTYLVERFKPGSKGGGGGDLADRTRGNFQDTAYWNPMVVTDKSGNATLNFTLPDNLTTWQLVAIGDTKKSQFGGAMHDFVATKDVIVRPVRPRFAVRGDRITLGAIVHNFLGKTQTFSVSLAGSGFTLESKSPQSITVKAGEMKTVNFPVTVTALGSMTTVMRAETGGSRDEIKETIPVYLFGTPQSVATTGKTDSVVTEQVLAPTEKDASEGKLEVTVSPTLATYLPSGLDYLLKYPYGCAEQTASTFLPQLMLKRLQGFDAFKIVPDKDLEKNITAAVQKLYGFQKSDGGFGYWEESWYSSPYLTGYVTYALTAAKQSGYAVDESVLKRANDYIDGVLHGTVSTEEQITLETRAYLLFVLSESGRTDGNLLSNMYTKWKDLPVFSRAELAMAMQKANMGGKARELLTHMLDAAKIDPRGAHVEERDMKKYRILMQTNTRTTAETLQAMIRIDPKNGLIPQFVRFLLAARKDGHWDTTQSTTQTILAFVEYLKSTNELSVNELAGIELNGKMIATQKFDKTNILTRKTVTVALKDMVRGQNNPLKIGIDQKGSLFYDAVLSYFYTGDTIAPLDEGMAIQRSLGLLDTKGSANLSSVKVGDTYRVTLTMTVPEDRYYVAVESPLPAGLEGIDLQLATSKQQGAVSEEVAQQETSGYWWMSEEEDNGLWRFSHKEFRDDKVFLFADYLPAGVYKYTYLVRATTPGTFHERPARMWEMYFPENFGQTEGKLFTVTQ